MRTLNAGIIDHEKAKETVSTILGDMNMDIFHTYSRLLSSTDSETGDQVFSGMNEMEEQLMSARPSARRAAAVDDVRL